MAVFANNLNGLVWLLLMLVPLLVLQRLLHREIQAVLLILTRRPALAIGLFAFLFFPGVALHETSHFFMARLLRVRTGRFSLLPKMLPDGRLRMGYVETDSTDFLRDALIGVAPLLAGGTSVAYIGISRLGLDPLAGAIQMNAWSSFGEMLLQLPRQPDFWLWFYLAFTISSTMFPSATDRRGWLPVTLIVLFLAAIALLAGAGPWLAKNLAPALDTVLSSMATVFAISLLPHIALVLPVSLLRRLITKLTGISIS
ncbi:MAG: hypothetical protein HPY59_16485 [Anaerolineae bacterium]|nr:hypothetical protein [Anaerolineae bacterium]